jgi:ribonuclease Z
MIECTFLDPLHIEEAIADRHIHWSQLENYIIEHSNTTFVIYHFSMRYTTEYIKSFFESKNILNIIPWIKEKE